MDPIKISINVNVELSQATRDFITGLFGTTTKAAPAAPVATTTTKAAPATTTTTKAAPAAPATTTTTKAVETSEYTVTDIRSIMAQKLNDHRAEIKKKLTDLGTDSVTNLAVEKYNEFVEYLKSLS